MCAANGMDDATLVSLSNSQQFSLESEQGRKYLIQVSWPLHWQDIDTTERNPVPVLYIVDGNALFLTATEVAWRRAASSHFAGGGIIVAVGYPLKQGKLYDAQRRSLDLTPPGPTPIDGYGGADEFLDFIEGPVRSAVRERLPKVSFSREALYGHSYGGLFALHALFTRPNAFECYIASSPSIWWNSRCILREAKKFLETQAALELPRSKDKSPALMLSWGGFEQNPPQWNNEPLDHYEGRKQIAKDLRMADNTIDLYEMVKKCEKLGSITTCEYAQEEHTSVMPCSLSKGLTRFFEDWPFHSQ